MDTTTTEQEQDTRLAQLIQKAQHLVNQIGDQAERDRQSYDAGFREAARLFFEHGRDVGYAQAEHDTAEEWAQAIRPIRAINAQPCRAELLKRRTEPGDLGRYARGEIDEHELDCHAAAWLRRGGDYTGGPTPWPEPATNTSTEEDNTTTDENTTNPWATLPRTAA